MHTLVHPTYLLRPLLAHGARRIPESRKIPELKRKSNQDLLGCHATPVFGINKLLYYLQRAHLLSPLLRFRANVSKSHGLALEHCDFVSVGFVVT